MQKNSVAAVDRSKTCIMVVGMHRSGTSAVTRLVNLLGADIASGLMPAVPDNNDRGFWESVEVSGIHDWLLHGLGSSWDDPLPLPDHWTETSSAQQAKHRLIHEINKDFSDSQIFVVKDPRIARLLPLWLEMLHELGIKPIIILTFRNPLEVAASLEKRDGLPTAQSMLAYIRSYLEAELASREYPRIFIEYNDLINNWHAFAKKLRNLTEPYLSASGEESMAEINNFLTADMHRNRYSHEQLVDFPGIAATVIEIYDQMAEAGNTGSDKNLRLSFDRMRTALEEATKLYKNLLTRLRSAVATRDSQIVNIQHELEKSLNKGIQLSTEIKLLHQQLGLAFQQIASVYRSKSWRITAPLRFVQRLVRRARGKSAQAHAPGLRTSHDSMSQLQTENLIWIIAQSGMFDANWYLHNNPDVAAEGIDPLRHYVLYGAAEGRNPSPFIDMSAYLASNPEIAAAGINPLVHYLAHRQFNDR